LGVLLMAEFVTCAAPYTTTPLACHILRDRVYYNQCHLVK